MSLWEEHQAKIAAARDEAYAAPLETFDLTDPERYRLDTIWPWFERLRRESPVHLSHHPDHGSYWSITRYEDVAAIDANHHEFSSDSELGGITMRDEKAPRAMAPFIALDPPLHDVQRKVLTPVFSSSNLKALEPLFRAQIRKIVDEAPAGEPFDLADRISLEVTAQMMATMFGFPVEHRRLLMRCADLKLAEPRPGGIVESETERQHELYKILSMLVQLWSERSRRADGNDLISVLANNPLTRTSDPDFYVGNLILLIVAGSDTIRHSITGAVHALNLFPDQFARLRADRQLLPGFVAESIRWQTPAIQMRRTAAADVSFRGQNIRRGDKVIMWYASANRDETVIEDPDRFVMDRSRPHQHAAFGFGVHRCIGQRLADLQLRLVWEALLDRFSVIEVVGEPDRIRSFIVRGFNSMMVRAETA